MLNYEEIEIPWKELQVGDIFECGSKVTGIQSWKYKKCYKLISFDKNEIIVSGDHLFNCNFIGEKGDIIYPLAEYGDEILEKWSTADDIYYAYKNGYSINMLPHNNIISSIKIYENGEKQKVRCITTDTGYYDIENFRNHNTTLLKYMANYKLEDKRNLCIIEDTNELGVDVPISLITNHHSKIKDLFTATLRENPSSIIIGETRTDEIIDILEAALTINVGTTIHANSFLRAIQRIVFMSIERNIPPEEVLNLINASIDCFIFMEKRKIKEIWQHKNSLISNIYEAYEKIL